jgi:hypothetical protein
MHKRKLHHLLVTLKKLHYWYLLVATLLFAVLAILALRQNNLTAVNLRNEVLKVDQENGDVEAALRKLRTYVYGHMNTSLSSNTSVYPPIQLKYRYERLVQAEKDRVANANTNTTYNDAQTYCEQTQPASFYGAGRLACIQSYIDSHPVEQQTEKPIPDALYKFDFASPIWSPDLAGWSLDAQPVEASPVVVLRGIVRLTSSLNRSRGQA